MQLRPTEIPRPQRPRQALERLVMRPDAAKLVRATAAQQIFLFIKELGLEDSTELLALCSTEQVQAFLDMDVWERDHLAAPRLVSWIAALCELGAQKLAAHVRRLDKELLTSFLGPRLRIYELAEEEPPEEPEGIFYATPDRFYLIDILPEQEGDEEGVILRRFLEELYSADLELARSIVQSARWDAGAETDELAYRFRSGRMADLGYIEYYEALKVYVLLDPLAPVASESAAADELSAAPSPIGAPGAAAEGSRALTFLPGLDESDNTFSRAAMYLSETKRALLFQQLLLLANRAMAADRVELGDAQAARSVLRRTAGYLSLGLEFRLLPPAERSASKEAGRKAQSKDQLGAHPAAQPVQINIAKAAHLLDSTSLLYLFRLGFSLTAQLRKLAGLLVAGQEGGLCTLAPAQDPAALLPARLAEPLRNLLLIRPLYSGYLEAAPAMTPEQPPAARPFMGLLDLGRAATFLSELSTLGKFLTTGLGLRRDNLAETLRATVPSASEAKLGDLLGTMIANLLLQRPPVFVPLARRDLPALRRLALQPGVKSRVEEALKARVHERALDESEEALLWSSPSRLLLDETLESLERSLGTLPQELSPALAESVTRLSGLVLT